MRAKILLGLQLAKGRLATTRMNAVSDSLYDRDLLRSVRVRKSYSSVTLRPITPDRDPQLLRLAPRAVYHTGHDDLPLSQSTHKYQRHTMGTVHAYQYPQCSLQTRIQKWDSSYTVLHYRKDARERRDRYRTAYRTVLVMEYEMHACIRMRRVHPELPNVTHTYACFRDTHRKNVTRERDALRRAGRWEHRRHATRRATLGKTPRTRYAARTSTKMLGVMRERDARHDNCGTLEERDARTRCLRHTT